MNPSPKLLAWGVIAAALPLMAAAQTIYKSVGPDGRVTYSQQPPVDQNARHQVIRGSAPAAAPSVPAAAPSAPAQVAEAPGPAETPAARLPAKKAIKTAQPPAPALPDATAAAASPAAAVPSSPTPSSTPAASNAAARATGATAVAADLDPALEKALIGVLGHEDLVHQANNLCVSTLPGLMSKYDDARKGWDTRNAAVVAKARQVMQQASPAKRQSIELAVTATNEANLKVVRQASPTSRIAWCGRTVDEVNGGALDLQHKPNLASPLMASRY